jgi:hypothetical protein
MVYGMKGRLAVECDGDHWHGPENYENDMGRQRDLERQGLKFWRILESSYNRDSNAALESLWLALSEQGIFPESQSVQVEEPQSVDPVVDAENLLFDVDEYDETEDLEDIDESNNNFEDENEGKHPSHYTIEEVESAIVFLLKNNSCVKGDLEHPKQCDLTAKVCKHLGIRTRGIPRRQFGEIVMKAVKNLIRKGSIQEYRAKNIRLRLVRF